MIPNQKALILCKLKIMYLKTKTFKLFNKCLNFELIQILHRNKRLNRTYTISKENNTNEKEGTFLERQKWDKQYNVLNGGLNHSNFNSNDRKYLTNEKKETPTWVEYSSENP